MSRIHAPSLLFAFTALLVTAYDVAGQTAQPPPAFEDRTVILAVTVNGLAGDLGAIFQQDEAGHLYAPASFLETWNLRPSELRVIAADGTAYFDLSGIDGLSYNWDQEGAELAISAAPEAFLTSSINIGAGLGRKVAPYTPGAYLNYDLSATHGPGASVNQALFDVALFRGSGLLTSSFLAGNSGNARLMTTWQTDQIDAIKTLRIGDSYNNTGNWGRGVLFGGIQYGTNFAVRPDFVTAAMPSVSGKALLPSTVDVYVNNALRSRQQVNAGPFSIQNLPVITGTGEVKVVVKDLLGREQLITQSFFASPNLLRAGLVQDSYEFGWLRENYGLTSNDYNDPFAAVTYRKGLSNTLTAEGRVELQKDLAATGVSVAAKLPGMSSVVETSVAASEKSGLPLGAMGSVSYSYLGRLLSASARLQLNGMNFRQIGSDPASLPKQIGSAQISAPLGQGTLSVNYMRRLNQGESMTRLVNLNYSHRLAANAFLSFTLIKPLSAAAGTTAALGLTILFDQRHVGSSTLTRGTGATALYTDFQQSTPRDEGTGYRLAAMNGGISARQEASVTRNQSYGSLQAELVRLNGEVSSRLNAQGGVATLGDGVYFSRGLDQGFAIVQTKDIKGVPVYLENQVVAHTNERGSALVSNVRSYQENRISIDPVTLPLEASVSAVEQTVVPRKQGGVLVDFKVRRVRSATLTIVQADGTLLPPWTPVEVAGMENAFVSGNRGEVFVELPDPKGNRVIARPEGGAVCELSVDQPDAGSTVPFLGPLQCAQSR
jgi:outer membrane usher protein